MAELADILAEIDAASDDLDPEDHTATYRELVIIENWPTIRAALGWMEKFERQESLVWQARNGALRRAEQAEADRDRLAQAMWDVRGILGFDNDGDPSPAATIAGMGYQWLAGNHVREAREQRENYDEALDAAERSEAELRKIRKAWDESWDCSRDPGHAKMNAALGLTRDA